MPQRSAADLDEQQDGEQVAVLRGADERREAPVVLSVDAGPGSQQRQHRPQVALERRPVQRRVPVVAHWREAAHGGTRRRAFGLSARLACYELKGDLGANCARLRRKRARSELEGGGSKILPTEEKNIVSRENDTYDTIK